MEPYVKFLRGTPSAYNKLSDKDKDTLYFVAEKEAESGLLYLGAKLISNNGGSGGATSLRELADVFITGELKDKSFLIYENNKWVNKTPLEIATTILPSFIGATDADNGKSGLVPVPMAGDQGKFLCGNGTWVTVQGSIPQDTLDTIDKLVTDVGNLEQIVANLDSSALEGRVVVLETSVGTLEQNYNNLNLTVQSLDERLKWQDMILG